MPRNGSGGYSLPEAAFTPGTTISSSAVNDDFSDIATALTGSIASDGQTPITGPLTLTAGSATNPAWTFTADATSGLYLAATGKVGITTNGIANAFFDGGQVGTTDNQFYYANGAIPCPVGVIMDWPGVSAPTGWLFIYGQVLAQATYPGLYAVCGTTFNTGGEGAGNFRMPDGRGRVTAGKDDMGGSTASRITNAGSGIVGTTLGAAGAAQNQTLTANQLAAHTHNGTSDIQSQGHTHDGSGTTSGQSANHTHNGTTDSGGVNHTHPGGFSGSVGSTAQAGVDSFTSTTAFSNTGNASAFAHTHTFGTGFVSNDHTHAYSFTTGNVSQNHTHGFTTNANSTAGNPVITVQPTIIFNKIIFAGR